MRLSFCPPLPARLLLDWLAARAVPGVEEIEGEAYRRSLRLEHGAGVVEVAFADDAVVAHLWLDDERDRAGAVERCRALLDLDADPDAVAAVLGGDPLLGPLVAAAPGLRVPGTVDADELAVRAVLGQQISVGAARTAAGRLSEAYGEPLTAPQGGVTRLFPSAAALAQVDPERLPMPRSRARALVGMCGALATGDARLDRASLLTLPGIGPWTAGYIAMRALGDRDVFLVEDLGVRHGLQRAGGPRDPAAARALAEAWAPWRSYASQYLWQVTPPA
jgi:AraC family transcriptional regulator, regulatory protein of adaptative response / DNA-3-methyladenine glycosylase II